MIGFRLNFCLVLALGLLLAGCLPGADSQLDEQKEVHFLTGKNRLTAMDFQGAIDSFEKALEVNPHSASAHFELGHLYEDRDSAAAIYHYQQFLKLRPDSDKADLVKSHINACKMELAKSITALGPQPDGATHDVEKLVLENRDLKTQLAQWQAYFAANRPSGPTNPPMQSPVRITEPAHTATESRPVENPHSAILSASVSGSSFRTPVATSGRTHTIRAGETPASIARKYGVTLVSLLAANPQVRPTHLQPGQTLNIPAS